MTLSLADIFAARNAISGIAVRTPLVPSPAMTEVAGAPFLMKLETTQPVGAFKLRGAVNAVSRLPEGTKGVACCSTGNHGRGVAYAAHAKGIRAVVCMSQLVPQAKVDGIRALGADVRIVGRSQDDAHAESIRLCESEGLIEISPFDDPHVVAGQGTIGLEILEDCPELAMLLVPLSGGGLAGGVALAAKAINPAIRVIGITMDRGAAMHASLKAGHPVEVEEVASLADSLGGGIGLQNRLTFDLCRRHLDDVILVTEEEIYRGMQSIYFDERMVAEGASAVGHAALLAGKLPKASGPIATILTGRNVDMAAFTKVVTGEDVPLGDVTVKGQRHAA
ncbi:hydroxyectoine utilization dehydratase EutB [Hartmannibacter diazotrophicus]|nr:hydroxyectoine utilization dehydratase EutB [Hartmannibacter diazotrophicus]